jgi:hypothetical protein
MTPLDALIPVVAVATLGTFTLPARPLVAIPGGLLATLAWLVAFAAATPRYWLLAALFLPMAGASAAYTVEAAFTVTLRERARTDTTRTEQAEEAVR